MKEVWKTIPIMGGNYEASSLGSVRSKDKVVKKRHNSGVEMQQLYKGRVLGGYKDSSGYIYHHLGDGGNKKNHQAGRLVLMAFEGMPPNGTECCHNNGDPSDNRIENIRWDTHKNNNGDRVKHGTYKRGTDHHFSKFSEELICNIKKGIITKRQALDAGVSNTHYWRIVTNRR